MPKRKKDKEIEQLKSEVVELFDQVEKMLRMSVVLTEEGDNEIAINIIEEDLFLDQLQQDLIININFFMLKVQPKAGDLRLAMASYGMSYDLERVGDYCKNFAKAMLKVSIEERKQEQLVINLLKELLTRTKETKLAFQTENHQLAKSIAKRDKEIDDLTAKLVSETINLLTESDDKKDVKRLTRIIMIAKTFERAGDHLVNICEQVSFISQGQIYHYS